MRLIKNTGVYICSFVLCFERDIFLIMMIIGDESSWTKKPGSTKTLKKKKDFPENQLPL